MLTLVPRYRFANALSRDRMISQVEGEAFAQKYLGVTDNIKREGFAPTGFQEMWVMPSLQGEGLGERSDFRLYCTDVRTAISDVAKPFMTSSGDFCPSTRSIAHKLAPDLAPYTPSR